MTKVLNGKTAIITGAGHGLGRIMVDQFLDAGAAVIAVDLNAAGLAELRAAHPEVAIVEADVSNAADADRIIAAAEGRLDVLVNNAAVLDRLALVDEISEEQWRRVLDINLTGPYLLCNRAVPRMLAQGGGVIINVASVAGLRGGRAGAAYTASKHGLIGLSENIAATLGKDGIRCIPLCPGGMATGMPRGGELSERGSSRISGRDREHPHSGGPENVASVAVFLASDAAAGINGSPVVADGGAVAY